MPSIRNGRQIFLIDALGASISAVMLGAVLPVYSGVFGMPKPILQCLALLALVLSIFGWYHFAVAAKKWQKPLKTLALANIGYCALTAALVVLYWKSLFLMGKCYFLLELLIIVVLVVLEYKNAEPKEIP